MTWQQRTMTILITLALAGCDGGAIGADNPHRADGAPPPPATDGGPPTGSDLSNTPTPDTTSQDQFTPQSETCNGFDDDLDGQVDEGCNCAKGATQKCYPGPAAQLTGLCKQGTQTCVPSGEFGSWGKCTGAVTPAKETCGDKVDQDCNGKDLLCPQKSHCDIFSYGKNSRPVDIVWVIDQSGSMDSEISMVRANMNLFAGYISKAKADYRVLLIASRYYDKDKNQICIPQPLAGPNCADSARFKQIDQHVDSHDALSRIVMNITTLEKQMRKGSVRRFVAVTDDDAKGTGWSTFHAFLKARAGYSDYRFHSIVALKDKGCAADDGKHYIALSNLTGGIKTHICSANWASVFTQLAQEASSSTSKFLLSKKPKGAITVSINGKVAAPGVKWGYNTTINQVELKQPFPQNGAQIKVCYQW